MLYKLVNERMAELVDAINRKWLVKITAHPTKHLSCRFESCSVHESTDSAVSFGKSLPFLRGTINGKKLIG